MEEKALQIPFRYWVEECRTPDLDDEPRIPILYGREFQDEIDNLNDRDFERPVQMFAFAFTGRSIVLPVRISVAHSFIGSRHWGLSVEGIDERVPFPCLMTNLLDTKTIGEHELFVEQTDKAKWIFGKSLIKTFPVESSNWFGLLTQLEECHMHLLAFSDQSDAEIKIGDLVCFTEWDDSLPVGTVTRGVK